MLHIQQMFDKFGEVSKQLLFGGHYILLIAIVVAGLMALIAKICRTPFKTSALVGISLLIGICGYRTWLQASGGHVSGIQTMINVLLMLGLAGTFGVELARGFRLNDHGWRMAIILGALFIGAYVVVLQWPPRLGVDLDGGVILVYEIDKSSSTADSVPMEEMVKAITRRVNPGGQKEIPIRSFGPAQIEIIIPQVSSEAEILQIKDIISRAGTLEFRILCNNKDDGPIIQQALAENAREVKDSKGNLLAKWVPLRENREKELSYPEIVKRERTVGKKKVIDILVRKDSQDVEGKYLNRVSRGESDGKPCVHFSFIPEGAIRFGQLTGDNLPDKTQNFTRKLGIILDGELYSAPAIQSTIHDQGQITGDFTEAEVSSLVQVLTAGKLPATLKKEPISELITGPTLGHDTVRQSVLAMIVASILVPLFMLWYYRFAGLVANVALILNMVLLVALMMLIHARFTLAGFAGLALTVGMAVDNNVLVFERLREEFDRGATLRMAIRNAFHRAGATIVDCNLTHLFAATVLFYVGSEQVRGFAVTLWLGCAISLFTAVFVAHVMFNVAEKMQWVTQLRMHHLIRKTSIDFMGFFPIAFGISIATIVIGLAFTFLRGANLFDIDFREGVSVQAFFKMPQDVQTVRAALKDLKDASITNVNVSTGEEPNRRFQINTTVQGEEAEQSLDQVKKYLEKTFPNMLMTNALTYTQLKGIRAETATTPSTIGTPLPKVETPAAPKMETKPEPKAEQKETPKEKDKPVEPAKKDQSRADLPSDSLLAMNGAEPWLMAQAVLGQEKPAEKPADKSAEKPVEKTIEKPADKSAAVKPAAPEFIATETQLTFEVPVSRRTVEAYIEQALEATQAAPVGSVFDVSHLDKDSKALEAKQWDLRIEIPPEKAKIVLASIHDRLQKSTYYPASSKIGAAVANKATVEATFAIVTSWMLIIIYLWIRFQNVAFGVAAVLALVHDVLVMLGALAASYWLALIPGVTEFLLIDQFKINLPIVAAFLTIIGYSVNDTIVVFDRIREVRGKDPDLTRQMVNDSTNQTLSRTILTSLTVFIVVITMYVLGGPALRGFAFALLVGVTTGTFSSIYVAAPLLLWMIGKHEPAAKSAQ